LKKQCTMNFNMREFHLFAGIGGGIYGGKLLGNTCVAGVEIDTFPQKILKQRQEDGWMDTFPIYEDLLQLDGKDFIGTFDILCGGFPCQAFSTAARGRNLKEKDLWQDMFRFIEESEAPIVFAENVAQKAIDIASKDLEAIGYKTAFIMLSNSMLGIEHRRNRYWLLAVKNEEVFNRFTEQLNKLSTFNGNYWSYSPDFFSMKYSNNRKQLKGIGNAQSPFVVSVAMRILVDRIFNDKDLPIKPDKEEISKFWNIKESWISKNYNIKGLVHTPTTMANYSAPSMMKHEGCRNFVEVFNKPNTQNAEWLMGFPIGASSPEPLGYYSELAGKDKNYLSIVKTYNPYLFVFYYKLGQSNFAKGIEKYENLYRQYSYEAAEMFYDLKDKQQLSYFYNKMNLSFLYSSEAGFINAMNNFAFHQGNSFSFQSFKKLRIIRKRYIKWKNEIS